MHTSMDPSVVAGLRHPVYPVAGPGFPGLPIVSHTRHTDVDGSLLLLAWNDDLTSS